MAEIWKPSVTVAAIAEDRGRFLLVEEDVEGRIVLNQPAGHLDPDESLIDAVVRETLEETAWRFEPAALVGIYQWHVPGKDVTYMRFTFCGRAFEKTDRPLDKEIRRAEWFSLDDVARRRAEHRSPLVMRCLEDYLAGKRYPLDLYTRLA